MFVKILYLSGWILWFQKGYNKVVIELRVVQVWSKIILVISNQTRAADSFYFIIRRMISNLIAFYSRQSLILFNWKLWSQPVLPEVVRITSWAFAIVSEQMHLNLINIRWPRKSSQKVLVHSKKALINLYLHKIHTRNSCFLLPEFNC